MTSPLEISGYTIEKEIGKGAMATVYLAIQDSLSRYVALKVMSPTLAVDETFAKRFIHEGKTVAKLEQNNIVNIFDIGTSEECCYIAMEYLSGGTLKDRMNQDMQLDEALHIIRQIALALGYAHQHHFVHRDIKPLNIMFRADNTAVLTDFGIAKDIEAAATALTATGASIGTPSYMSPEQAKGEELDGRSDIYCLGVVFFELLTGGRPYVASDPFALALKHISAPIPKLPDRLGFLQGMLKRLLAKNPEKRFQTAEELISEIDRIQRKYDTHKIPVLLSEDQSSEKTELWHQTMMRHLPGEILPSQWKRAGILGGAAIVTIGLLWAGTLQYLNYMDTVRQEQIKENKLRIELLLAKGERQIALSQLVKPEGDNAFDTYMEITKLDPDNQQAAVSISTLQSQLHNQAQTAASKKSWNEALSLIEKGLQLGSEHSSLLSLQTTAEQALEQEKKEKQARELENKIANLIAKAERQIQQHQLSQPSGNNAYETFQEILKLAPEDPRALTGLQQIATSYAQLAQVQMEQGRNTQSEALIERGLSVIPDDQALMALKAELDQRKVQLQIKSLLEEAEALAAKEQFNRPAVQNSVERYKAVLEIDPANEIASQRLKALPKQILALAEAARNAGDLSRSMELTDQGLQLSPDDEGLRAQKEHLLLDQHVDRLLEKAQNQLRQSYLVTPKNNNVLTTLAEIMEHPPDHAKAKTTLQEILDQLAVHANSLLDQEKEQETQDVLGQALAFFPDHQPLLTVQKALERTVAEREQRQLKIKQLLADAKKLVAQERIQQPADDNAYAYYQTVLQLDPVNDSARQALNRLPTIAQTAAKKAQARGDLKYSLELIAQGTAVAEALGNKPELDSLKALEAQVSLEQRIHLLLTQAEQQMAQRQLDLPPNDNATNNFKQVLELSPKHPKALDGLKRIADLYSDKAKNLLQQNQEGESLRSINKGLTLIPDHPGLLDLQGEIQQRQLERTAQEQKQRKIEDHMARAREQENLKQLTQPPGDNAQESYQAILKLDPEHEAATQALAALPDMIAAQAQLELNGGAHTRSQELVNEGLKLAPEHRGLQALEATLLRYAQISDLLQQAEQQLTAGQLDKAANRYREVLELSDDQPEAQAGQQRIASEYARQAEILLERGDEAGSETQITAGLAIVEGHPPLLTVQQALTERRAARAAQEAKARLLTQLQEQAHLELQQGQLEKSFATISQGLTLEPQHPALLQLQQELQKQQQIQQLLAKANQQIERNQLTLPADDNAAATLNQVLKLARQHPEAIKAKERVADAYLELARSRVARQQQEPGLRMIEKGLGVVPDYPPLLALREEIEKQIELQRLQAQINDLMTRAQEQQRLEYFTQPPGDNAQESYQAILNLDPEHEAAVQALAALPDMIAAQAQLELNGGAHTRSQELVDEGLELAPEHRGLQALEATLLRYAQISDLLQQAEQQLTTGQLDKAASHYREVLELSDDQPEALAGLQRIASEYARQAEILLERGDEAGSEAEITAGLAVIEGHPPLLAVQQSLTERRAARAAQEAKARLLTQLQEQARLELQQGQLEKSFATINRGLTLEPQHPTLLQLQQELQKQQQIQQLLAKANQQIERNQLTLPADDNAAATLNQVLKLTPQHPEAIKAKERVADAYLELARNRVARQQQEPGLRMIEKGLGVVPDYPPLLALREEIEHQIELQRRQAQINDLMSSAQQQQRLEHFTQPLGDNAQESYHAVLKLDPEHEAATQALAALPDMIAAQAQLELDGGAHTRSRELVDEGLKLAPEHRGLQALESNLLRYAQISDLLQQAEQQLTAGQLDKAAGHYREVLALSDDQPEAQAGLQRIASEYAHQADILLKRGDEAGSEALVNRGLMVVSKHPPLLALQQELAERRTARADRASKQHQVEQLVTQAEKQLKQGQLENSLATIKEGLLLEPDQQSLLQLRQSIQREKQILQLLAKADQQIRRSQLTLPTDNNAVATLREVLVLHPDHPQAITGLIKVADTYARLASNRLERGQEDQAVRLIERGLSVVPEHPPLTTLLEEHATRIAARADKQRQIDDLIKKAREQQHRGRYTAPKDDNALDSYRSVLKLEPNNAAAQKGLRDLAGSLHKRASDAYAQADADQSLKLIREGLMIAPGHKALLQLQQQIKQPKLAASVAMEDEKNDRINHLLAQADSQIERNQLTQPPGNNAAASLREVLKLEPGHPQAEAGLQQIVDKYATLARDQITKGHSTQGRSYIDLGLSIDPNHKALLALKREIEVVKKAKATASKQSRGSELRDTLKDGGQAPVLVYIPGGEFRMGDGEGNGFSNEKPAHLVQIKRAFYIAKYEVTFEEFDRFTNATNRRRINDQGWGRGKRPVINVSWHDAQAYVKWLSQQTGQAYRLPTEREWEYAARAGTSSNYWWGNKMVNNRANCKGCGSSAGGKRTLPVGSFKANPFGLFDTAGNVYEWTISNYTQNYQSKPSSSNSSKVARGGSWFDDARFSRAPMRLHFDRNFKNYFLGFRVIRDL